jgi:primase-polymerase (primpol)-like protein
MIKLPRSDDDKHPGQELVAVTCVCYAWPMSRDWKCSRAGCSKPLPLGVRSDAKYCSGACRVAAHRTSVVIPRELRKLSRWVRYTSSKVPLTAGGSPASSTDPVTWSSYLVVKRSKAGVGPGFVLNGDGIVCIDLDKCINPSGDFTPAARQLIELAGNTYIEVSPSGRGLHIWGRAVLSHGRCLTWNGQPVELYPRGRYMTVTGRQHGASSELGDLSRLVTAVLEG